MANNNNIRIVIFNNDDYMLDLGGKMMVTTDVITIGAEQSNGWFLIAGFFFIMWAITMFFLIRRIEEVKVLRILADEN